MFALSFSCIFFTVFARAAGNIIKALTYLDVLVMTLFLLPQGFLQLTPVVAFYVLYGELAASLTSWCQHLIQRVRMIQSQRPSPGTTAKVVDECYDFLSALSMTGNLVSGPLFAMTGYFMSSLIIGSYRAIAFFIGQQCYGMDWVFWLQVTGFVGACFGYVWCQRFLVFTSETVLKEVLELTDAMVPLNVTHDDPTSVLVKNTLPLESAKLQVLHQLKSFDGFSAHGYFSMNKSSLSSMLTNYVTYLIILLQFRVGEKSTC